MKTQHNVNRRKFLRASGSAMIALPFLPSLAAKSAWAQSGTHDPLRFATVYFPNGTDSGNEWQVSGQGHENFELREALSALDPLKDHLSVITHLNNTQVTGPPPAHARGTAAFLTGVEIHNQSVARVGISIDQVIAQSIGQDTAFSSLELGPAPYAGGNPVDTGWPTPYNCNMSWSSPEVFNSPEQSPRALFDRLFAQPLSDQAAADARRRQKRSILDYVMGQTQSLQTRASASDRRTLDQYLTAIREVERRIDQPSPDSWACDVGERPSAESLNHPTHTKAMLDLMVLALQCDLTRVLTYMMDFGFGNKDFSFLVGGYRRLHHNITHGGPGSHAEHRQVTGWYCDQLAYLLQKMSEVEEETGSLLDNSIVLFGSSLGNGRGHGGDNLPLILAGRGGGQLNPGQRYHAGNVSHRRLLLTLAQKMGVNTSSFAGETQTLSGL